MNESFYDSLFMEYEDLLSAIGVYRYEASERMLQLHEHDITTYTAPYISRIFHLNLLANRKKYEELVEIYEREIDLFSPISIAENYIDTRTPDLVSTSSTTGSSSSLMQRNQSTTQITTPATTTTTSHSVNPYDNTGLQTETQDSTTDSGNDTTVTSYSGSPDTTSGTSTASGSVHSGGTETIAHSLKKEGRDGRFKVSDIIDDAEQSAKKLDILDIIINDVSNQVFLQMWL